MQKVLLVVVAALSMITVTGCKKKGAGGDALAKLEGFSKAMCECKDKACADKVQADMTKWSEENAKTAGKETEKPDPELTKKMTDASTKLGECYSKLAMPPATGGTGGEAKPDEKKPDEAAPAAGGEAKPADPAAGEKKDDKKPDDKKAGGW